MIPRGVETLSAVTILQGVTEAIHPVKTHATDVTDLKLQDLFVEARRLQGLKEAVRVREEEAGVTVKGDVAVLNILRPVPLPGNTMIGCAIGPTERLWKEGSFCVHFCAFYFCFNETN